MLVRSLGMSVPAIVHIEFKSSDFARTAAFYAKLFDWRTEQNASGRYMKLDSGDGPSAGWVRADLVQAAGPVTYLLVDDLPAKLDAVERAGGRVLAANLPFAGGGEIGLFADPDGNVIGLWQRKGGGGDAAKAAPKAPAPAAGAPKAATPASNPKKKK